MPADIHLQEFHTLLRENLHKAGIPLNVEDQVGIFQIGQNLCE